MPTSGAALYTRIVKSSVVYGLALLAPTLASLITLPIFTRYLSPADYGVIELLSLSQNLFGLLVGGRFAETLFYFYAHAKDEEERSKIVSTAMSGAFLIGAAGAALGCISAGRLSLLVFQNAQWKHYFYLTSFTFGLSLPTEMGFAWLRARDASAPYLGAAVARLASGVLFVATLLIVFRAGVAGVLWGNLLSAALTASVVSICWLLRVRLCFVPRIFGNLLRFAIPMSMSGIALFVIHSGDRFFLQRYVPISEVGIYSLAYKVGMLVSLAQSAFGQYWAGQSYFVISGERRLERFGRVNTYLMAVLIYSAVGVSLFAEPVVRTVTPARFWPCIPLIPWIAAAYVIRAQADYLRVAFYLHGKPSLDTMVIWIAAAICLGAYAGLIPIFNLWGAVAATSLTFVVLTCLAWVRIRRLSPYWLEYKRLGKLVAAAIVVTAAAKASTGVSLWTNWAVAWLGAIAFPALLWLGGGVEENEKAFVALSLNRLKETAREYLARCRAAAGQA